MNASSPVTLSPVQTRLLRLADTERIFLEGAAGSGKTTAARARLQRQLRSGLPPEAVLVLLPSRTLAGPYAEILGSVPGSPVTLAGLAQRGIQRYWEESYLPAGFPAVERGAPKPSFISYEVAQYFMGQVVEPMARQGAFQSVVMERHRLYSQILDNLSQAALNRLPHTGIGLRLKSAWEGAPGQLSAFEDVQAAASRFRRYCLDHHLLDFSLQIEIFLDYVWADPARRAELLAGVRQVLADNVEELAPATQDVLADLLHESQIEGALLVYDTQAGYRRLSGADPEGAYSLKGLCPTQLAFEDGFVTPPELHRLALSLEAALGAAPGSQLETELVAPDTEPDEIPAVQIGAQRFYPAMLDWAVDQVADLVQAQGVPPSEIVILAPGLNDALRFSLAERLERRGIRAHWQRPSRALRDEPAAQTLLTLAALAYPGWAVEGGPLAPLASSDLALALAQAIPELDLVRATLLVDAAYQTKAWGPSLLAFDAIPEPQQRRIGTEAGERYEALRRWLDVARQAGEVLPVFLERLFLDLLTQPGFGYAGDLKAAESVRNMVDSARQFETAAGSALAALGADPEREYAGVVRDGLLSGQYLTAWQPPPSEVVLLAAAYTFVLSQRPVDYQVWLDVGSYGWLQRPYQPLAQPYVLNRRWPEGQAWTDQHEMAAALDGLQRLALGLLRRCRQGLRIAYAELGEQGYEQRGPLWRAIVGALGYGMM